MTGIYKITNKINNKSYIGQSKNIKYRWKNEKNDAYNSNSESYNYPLSRAFRKYGLNNFTFEVLEECNIEDLDKREQYYIDLFDSIQNGYNQVNVTQGGTNLEPAIVEQIRQELLFNKNDSTEKIGQKYNVSGRTIRSINTGETWFSNKHNYPIRISLSVKKQHFCKICQKEINKGATYCINCLSKKQQKVEHPSKEELKKILFNNNGNFTKVGKIFGVTDNAVRKWCKNYNLPFHSSDYKNK